MRLGTILQTQQKNSLSTISNLGLVAILTNTCLHPNNYFDKRDLKIQISQWLSFEVTACSTPIFSNELGLGFHTSAFLRLLGRKKKSG
jgi:hypothetical protein